jgi:hypothetical protein
MAVSNLDDFQALDPFFRIIEEGVAGLVVGEHFFDLLAEDVVFDCLQQPLHLGAIDRRPRDHSLARLPRSARGL